ncbi:probable inactive receptor-like protein kinase At3g56050 [Vigna unguiculata]|uniref:LRR receptor-like serine/threonine-protein kinase FLS2 n=1 Tax=Vigna unguiculata TaxID=3917 RepID=A0A4D6MB33_VIGUN|nr:probable inactive receptor-like protein kinase At3g56050 [Vigna unguiculata]QCD98619.1 LRR receptor-like serine/threonine-protein kinase FLS2 [Vigna unguiculata]
MTKNWKSSCFRDHLFLLALCLLFQNFSSCCSLNEEGKALLKFKQGIVRDPFGALSNWVNDEVAINHCNWFGVECSAGRVVVLNLKDLCLEGNLVPELANLVHIKSIILRNNSFYGIIPEGIAHLNELEVLDLGYNNFSGHLPTDLGNNISMTILLLDNNEHLCGFSPEINKLKLISEYQVDERLLSMAEKVPACTRRFVKRHTGKNKKGLRRLLQSPRHSPFNRAASFPDSPPPSSSAPSPAPATPPPVEEPAFTDRNDSASNSLSPSPLPEPPSTSGSSKNNLVVILVGVIGGVVFLVISSIGIYLCKTNKVATVKPWATGLSGQLQKAFITGVPKLKRSELEAACEDFSNVIGTSSIGTVYKGTLSTGVEIAVASVAVTSSKDWSKTLEAQFRKKIDTLSKVNHKNFVNLLGHCEEDEPFTRMVVFEYAPNGTLFEHLHIKEAEHLDWETRLRVAMGMAYCLQHVHQLEPPLVLGDLNSSAVQLTDDCAAKVSDLSFLTEIASAVMKSSVRQHPDMTPASNIYSFGVILFEMVTGRLPYSVDNDGSLDDWASQYLHGNQPLKEMVDPSLASFQEEQLEQVDALIKSCVHPDPKQRPSIKEVCLRLREITKITPEAAVPKLSPLWWAELEIASVNGN